MKLPRILWLFCLWAFVAGGYFLLRSSFPLVWDDTPKVCATRYDHPDYEHTNQWNGETLLERSFKVEWRPLASLDNNIGMWWFGDPNSSPLLRFAVGGATLGCMVVAVFLVARRFTTSPAWALLAVFLLLFSTPVVTGASPIAFNMQAVVPLSLCLGLLTYWRLVECATHRVWYTLALVAVLILGPWYREFVGILPLLIVWLEVKRARRFTWVMGLAALGFLHALFPTALLKWVFFPEMPLKSVFATGLLGHVMTRDPQAGSWLTRQVQNLKWEIGYHFLVLYPPLFLGLAFLGYCVQVVSRTFRSKSEQDGPITAASAVKSTFFVRLLPILLPALYVVCLALLYVKFAGVPAFFYLALALGVALVAYQTDSFLAVWFLLSFLPFLKVFTEQVHLAYAVLPASIGLACAVERLHISVSGVRWPHRLLRYGFMVVLLVALVDHGLNLYGSYQATTAATYKSQELARWFRANVPPGSVVVSNGLQLQDIRLWSEGHIETYWTVGSGIPWNESDLSDPAKLEELLRTCKGRREVYFLDVDFNYRPDKGSYHCHKYIKNHSVAVEEIGLISTLRTRYPYLDPFKSWTPRRYLSFMGPPDLENDFYTGPAQDGTRFQRELYAEYHLYKVTGTVVDRWDSNGPVRLVEEGYRHFNLLELNGRYFAVPQEEGAFDLQKVWSHGYSACFVADSATSLRQQIDGATDTAP